jgi:hypothetical protein
MNNLKTFADTFTMQVKSRIEELISYDEYASKTGIVQKNTIFEDNTWKMPVIIQNSEFRFDIFTYIIMLKPADNGQTTVSVKYLNQNVTDVTEFGIVTEENSEDIIAEISADFQHRFNASKGDFTRTSR